MTSEERDEYNIRQERRDKRLKKRFEHGQMQRHGGSLAKIYQNAVTKHLNEEKPENKKKRKK